MGKTKLQWYEVLKSWVPQWWFAEEVYSKAVFRALAAVFEQTELDLDEHLAETFILQSEGRYTDEHGIERNLTRGTDEVDHAFQIRIQNITNTTNIPALKAAIEAILVVGCAKVVDNESDQPFYDREYFIDRAWAASIYQKNFFTIWINPQVTGELDFMFDTEECLDREAFYSSNPLTQLDYVYEAIITLVNRNKALGTMYQVIVTDEPLCA